MDSILKGLSMRIFEWVKKQILHLIPAFIFFFISFMVINFTVGMIVKKDGISPVGVLTILLASLIVAKVLLIVDNLPFLNFFPKKPVIYNVIWKTFLYSFVALLFRLGIRLLTFIGTANNWTEEFDEFLMKINWSIFWSVQIWYVILFGVYVIFREFVYEFGAAKIRRLFFGR